MLTFAPLTASDLPRVAHVRVHPDQIKFCGTVAEAFETSEAGVDFHAVLKNGTPIGFFKIDRAYGRSYPFAAPDGLGLRAFMIDATFQGQGLGTAACRVLPRYLRTHYANRDRLWLTVNIANPAALRAYKSGGFSVLDMLWPHGAAGPQNVMWLDLT